MSAQTLKKIKFVTNGGYNKWTNVPINPAYLMLKNYYEFRGKYPVEWLEWEPIIADDEETQIQRILKEKPDLLALSFYVWNEKRQYLLAKRIKNELPNTVIMVGGPQLAAHKNANFFNEHPYIDFVCYGDGEKSFLQLIHTLHGDEEPFVNLVENRQGQYILHPYEIFVDEEFFDLPTYTLQKPIVESVINKILASGYQKKHIEFGIEFARGCMYKCSFCDWSQNLTKKVKRRHFPWKEELDYFAELDVGLYSTDANFGQWQEDFDIFNYGLSLHKPGSNFKFYSSNTPKLKKEAIYYISLQQALKYDYPIVLNLQDINEDVLEKIDRPSIPYIEIVELIKRFKENLPPEKQHLLTGQVIVGMPGQTLDKVTDMFKRLILDGVHPALLWTNIWVWLENAPAADPFYQKLHGLEWIDTYSFYRFNDGLNQGLEDILKRPLRDLYEMIKNKEFHPALTNLRLIKKTKYMDFIDIIGCKNLAKLIRAYTNQNKNITLTQYQDESFLNSIFAEFILQNDIDKNEFWEQNKHLIEEYGFAVLAWKRGEYTEVLTY